MLNKIFSSRYKIAKLEGYSSVLEKTMLKENLDSYIIKNLINSVHINLDILRKHLKLKSTYLEIKHPHLYDFDCPLSTYSSKLYSLDEAVQIIHEALKPLGTKYERIVNQLLENGHVDAIAREEKHQSITFSWHTYSFLNFKGTYLDLKNLIHELGHIVNYYLSKENVCPLYEDSSTFIGEIAAIVNELLLNHYLYENANSEEEKLFFLNKNCENYITSIFKQTMYTEFENILYKRTAEEKTLSTTFLNHTYLELIQKYYEENIIYDKESAFEWTKLGHIYRHAYYPYQYATGLLMASIVINSLIKEKTISNDEYIKFLSSGSSNYPLGLLKILHIDWNDNTILNQGFEEYKTLVSQLEKIINNIKKSEQ